MDASQIPEPAADLTRYIEKIHGLTGDLTLPDGACRSWTQLYADLGVFFGDPRDHTRLENDILFPPFETGDSHHV